MRDCREGGVGNCNLFLLCKVSPMFNTACQVFDDLGNRNGIYRVTRVGNHSVLFVAEKQPRLWMLSSPELNWTIRIL
ncbi:hypothetical protein AHAS_Ahas03G0375500 [Arachis hypogaea]